MERSLTIEREAEHERAEAFDEVMDRLNAQSGAADADL